jgi:hypothetical protein
VHVTTRSPGPGDRPETEWERRKRLAAVFGDALPDTTSDERDDPAERRTGDRDEDPTDAWLRSQVPPHHG